MREFEMVATFNGEVIKGLALPVVVMDEDFFEFIEDELCYTGGPIDIGLFALYYLEWEKENVE